MSIRIKVDSTNPGQFFACCGLLEFADRLWPGAEGWYDGEEFCIECGGTLAKVLTAAQQAQFTDEGAQEGESNDDSEDTEDDDSLSPLEIMSPISMRLDWWQDKSLKPWAGSMKARAIALAMCRAIHPEDVDPLNRAQVVYDPMMPTSPTAKKPGKQPKPREPFHLDARRGANALGLDVGFVPDSLKKKWKVYTQAHPAVEFLALVGLQRCRPTPTSRPRVFDYFTWSVPCEVAVLPAAVNGFLGDPRSRQYRFKNVFRTGQKKHKAFAPAIPIPSGDLP
jgi:CRISPR-associated protein Csx14